MHGPPYPELTVVLIPKIVTQRIFLNCTADEDDTAQVDCNCDSPGYVQQASCREDWSGAGCGWTSGDSRASNRPS